MGLVTIHKNDFNVVFTIDDNNLNIKIVRKELVKKYLFINQKKFIIICLI